MEAFRHAQKDAMPKGTQSIFQQHSVKLISQSIKLDLACKLLSIRPICRGIQKSVMF
jgi:hypothetical protein